MQRISRRSFLKLTCTAAVVAAGTAMLSGCGVNTVTVIAMQNGVEVSRARNIPMPSSMSVDWAIDLMRPIYLSNIRLQYPELDDELNSITFEADPEYPNNGQQVQDESGNWTMTIAIKTNITTVPAKIVTTDNKTSLLLTPGVPVIDSWKTLPDPIIANCVQSFQDQYRNFSSVTYARNEISKDQNGKPTSVTVYVNAVKAV